MMDFSIQSVLENHQVQLIPLNEEDFEVLYRTASDPKIWEQHPNKDRWKRDVFATFFEGAMKSKGAFKIIEKSSGEVIGSTRFYDYNPSEKSILIGYTFYAINCWGKGINSAVKKLMLDYIFQYVEKVDFHIGSDNLRSQIAIQRLNVTKVGEMEVEYFGEKPKLNFVYRILKEEWGEKN